MKTEGIATPRSSPDGTISRSSPSYAGIKSLPAVVGSREIASARRRRLRDGNVRTLSENSRAQRLSQVKLEGPGRLDNIRAFAGLCYLDDIVVLQLRTIRLI